MADARGAGRMRPRGAAKIKLHGSTANSKLQLASAASPKNTVLPKLKIAASSNNNNSGEHPAPSVPFSPRVREIPTVLPSAPHPPTRPAAQSLRPAPPTQPTIIGGFDLDAPTVSKNAWSTPRSPVPETSEPPSESPSNSALDAFFHTDGSSVRTPARLLSVEETLRSTEQLYPVDWTKLQADADKFLEISATAGQHLDGIQADLPVVASMREQTKGALLGLSKEIETLHGLHGAEKEKLLVQFEGILTQRNDERAALESAQAAESKALEEAHEAEVAALRVDFQRRIDDVEERSAVLEKECLQEIEQLKQTTANELQHQRERSQTEQEQLECRFRDEIHELRTRSDEELTELRSSSDASYQNLLNSSQREISELKSTSASEIERLVEASASTLAEVTDKLTTELAETKEEAARVLAMLKNDHNVQLSQLERASADDIARLSTQHEADRIRLEYQRDRRVTALEQELASARASHALRVEQLTARFTAELSATMAMLKGVNNTLAQHHARELAALRSSHADEVRHLVASHDSLMLAFDQSHADKLQALENEATSTREAMAQQHDSELRSVRDETKREKDRKVLRYESDLDFLRRSTAEQIETISSERELAIQQLREAHAARVLALETTMRDNGKCQSEAIALLEEDLEDKKARVVELEGIEEALRSHISLQTERGQEETSRWSMRVNEMEAAITRLEHCSAAKDEVIESLKRDLRVSEDGNHTKSNTLLELTFVIKSRDEEIEKLHASLLDTIQNVNSKTEILEITAETLSSKAKELEETRAALRMESGRLSRVEEDVQTKVGMLEDSEMKIENMRLQLETMRLEMKRLQMDMRLQHEHSAGEMELKQGEIRRLHAAQTELKQKNDIHQETIVGLEGSLSAAQRQGDEMRRRVELLKLEAAQYIDEARKLGDELLEKEKQNVVLTKETQTLHNEKVKLQIQLNNLQVLTQTQREQLERGVMSVEDVHCQYQRRLEMATAEKDARLHREKPLLLLELNALKATLRQYEYAESKLHSESASLSRSVDELVEEKVQLEASIKAGEEEVQRVVYEKTTAVDSLIEQLKELESQLDERSKRVETLQHTIAETQQVLSAREALIASVSSDASSINSLLEQKDAAIAMVQQRLDEVSQEKLTFAEEVAALREQIAQLETVCHEKDEEIADLEKAFNSESEAQLRDIKASEEHQSELEEQHKRVQTVSELEAVITKERSEKATQGQAHQEANFQIQYLVTALKTIEDSLVSTSSELKKLQSEKATQSQAHEEANLQIQFLVENLKSAEDALAVSQNQLEQVRNEKAAEGQAHQEANFQIQYLVATLKEGEEALAAAMERLHEKELKASEHVLNLEESQSECQQLVQRLADVQQKLAKTEKALAESEEVVRVRKATVDNVRKEMALLMEMQRRASGANEGESGDGTAPGGLTSDRMMEHVLLQLLKQQVETFVNEEFHVEAPEIEIETEEDLLKYLKGAMRMRYCLSVIGSACMLTEADVCGSLRTLQQISRVAVGDVELSVATLPTIENSVKERIRNHTALVEQLRDLLDLEDPALIGDTLQSYMPVFSLLKDLSPTGDVASVHAFRSAALLRLVSDHNAIKASAKALLASSCTALETDAFQSLDDLTPLMVEASFLRQQVAAHRDNRSCIEEASSEPLTNFLLTSEQQLLLSERHLLLAELANALEWREHQASPPLSRSIHIVDDVRELMKVVRAFESLSSSRRRDEISESSVPDRTRAIVAFVEELRLITQFAQNIMDEEADATAAGAADHSHTSSSSSLLSLRGVATRTPTPTRDLHLAAEGDAGQSASVTSLVQLEIGTEVSSPEDTMDHGLILSGDALAPTVPEDRLRPSLSGALSESLLDISLVMKDHHRILSEAAHWVGKAHSMSPRNKRKMQTQNGASASIDFAAELSHIVRDHCSLLSLARKLFHLQDPRQDLPSVLQCLAVLSRLTGRLGSFDASIRASDSTDSLHSNAENHINEKGEASQQHEKLKASLSVFASMEEMARHLQDYDAFLSHIVHVREPAGGSIENIEALSGVINERLKLIDQLGTSLGLTNVVDELPVFVEAIQRLASESIAKKESGDGNGGFLPVDTILTTIENAFHDSESLNTLAERMRETLPFGSSAETPGELMERLKETISQCGDLIHTKEQAWKMVENLTEQLAIMDKQHAEEDEVLREIEGGNVDGLPRVERLGAIVERLKVLRCQNEEMAASIAAENQLLHDERHATDARDSEEPMALDDRVAIVRTLLEAKATFTAARGEQEGHLRDAEHESEVKLRDAENASESKLAEVASASEAKQAEAGGAYETKLHETQSAYETRLQATESALENRLSATESTLESKLRDAESQLVEERHQLQTAIEEEKNFLIDKGIDWSEGESRLSIYGRLVSECDKFKCREQRARDELAQEAAFLSDHGMTLVMREDETHASRLFILQTLFEGQRVLIDEKREREIADQQEIARLEAEGIDIPNRDAVVTRVIDLTKLVKQLVSESAAQTKVQEEVNADEVEFLRSKGITGIHLTPAGSRIPIFESLLERVEAAKQTLIAWEGSPHGDALGCREADDLREMDREKLEQQYVEATAVAVAAALEKQAQQLDFRRAALAAGDTALSSLPVPPPSKTAEEFIEAFTKRDNDAISMIYRLIRLTTDVLNTSAFSNSSNGGGEIPVDLTQAVMTCVKELKALKEYLLQSLEQISRDSGAFTLAQPPLMTTRESVTERDTAIDFALMLQRDSTVRVQKILEDKCAVFTSTAHKLSDSLAAHAGDFSDAEAKYMAMEVQLASETAEKATIEAKYATQDEFVQRFVDERKRVEEALLKALEEAKQERAELRAKMEMLEAEKCEAVALAHANGLIATPSSAVSTPRTPMSSNGRMYATVVPTRPDRPRELTSSRLKTGSASATGAVHKERFVSDLERETGQRRTANTHAGMTARRANEWKRHELLTSSTQIEQQFRAMNDSSNFLSISSPDSPTAPPKDRSLADQELWYQGVRMLQHVSFFVSVFFVPKQKTFRVEVFNSDSEQQQTIYVTLDEMQSFLRESQRAIKNGVTLDDPARYSEVVDVLFERVKVLGADPSNLLFAFQ